MKARQMEMTQGSLLDKLFLFAMPLAASGMLQLLFNTADIAVVGHFAGKTELAAVGCTTHLVNLFVNFITGLSVGANVVLAKCLGQRRYEDAPAIVHTILTVALIAGVGLMIVGQALLHPVLILMSTPTEVLGLSTLYLRLYFFGLPFIVCYNFGAAILRSKGDTQRPLFCLIASGILNVLLNLLLVIVFHLGVTGVAIATLVSNVLSFSLVIRFLVREDGPLHFDVRQMKLQPAYVKATLLVGIPAGLQGMVFSLANISIQSGINSFGEACMAGASAANNFESFVFMTISAFGQATVTFTSQNYAAREYERCRRVVVLSWLSSTIISGVLGWTFFLGRRVLIQIYNTDPEVMAFGMERMARILRFQMLMPLYEIPGGSLRGTGHSALPAAVTIFGTCILRLVWRYTVFVRWPSFGVLLDGYPISFLATGLLMVAMWLLVVRPSLRKPDLDQK